MLFQLSCLEFLKCIVLPVQNAYSCYGFCTKLLFQPWSVGSPFKPVWDPNLRAMFLLSPWALGWLLVFFPHWSHYLIIMAPWCSSYSSWHRLIVLNYAKQQAWCFTCALMSKVDGTIIFLNWDVGMFDYEITEICDYAQWLTTCRCLRLLDFVPMIMNKFQNWFIWKIEQSQPPFRGGIWIQNNHRGAPGCSLFACGTKWEPVQARPGWRFPRFTSQDFCED